MSVARNSDGSLVYLHFKKVGKKMSNSTRSVNWSTIVNELGSETVRDFAAGDLSGRGLYEISLDEGQESSPEVRNLLRSRGVNEARRLARKALSRR